MRRTGAFFRLERVLVCELRRRLGRVPCEPGLVMQRLGWVLGCGLGGRSGRVLGCGLRLRVERVLCEPGLAMRAPVYIGGSRWRLRDVNYVCLGGRLAPAATPPTGPDQGDEEDSWRVGAGRAQKSARGHQSGGEGCYYFLQRRFPQLLRGLDSSSYGGGKR